MLSSSHSNYSTLKKILLRILVRLLVHRRLHEYYTEQDLGVRYYFPGEIRRERRISELYGRIRALLPWIVPGELLESTLEHLRLDIRRSRDYRV